MKNWCFWWFYWFWFVTQASWPPGTECVAKYNFQGSTEQDLPFCKGDLLTIIGVTKVTTNENHLEGRGIFKWWSFNVWGSHRKVSVCCDGFICWFRTQTGTKQRTQWAERAPSQQTTSRRERGWNLEENWVSCREFLSGHHLQTNHSHKT